MLLGDSCRLLLGAPVACCVGTPLARWSGTSLPLFDCSSTCMLRGGASVLGGGATGTLSSSDHSDTMALHVRVVWSPPSEMPPGLTGVALAVFLCFWASSSTTVIFPWTFSDTRGQLSVRPASVPPDSDEALAASSLGRAGGRASTPLGQSPFGTPEKYTPLSCEWIFA